MTDPAGRRPALDAGAGPPSPGAEPEPRSSLAPRGGEPDSRRVPRCSWRRAGAASSLLPPGAEPFAAGRDADIYSIDDQWVLRRYRDGYPVRDEADFMRHVAKYDYPVPAVREVVGPDMVIQRLERPDPRRRGDRR